MRLTVDTEQDSSAGMAALAVMLLSLAEQRGYKVGGTVSAATENFYREKVATQDEVRVGTDTDRVITPSKVAEKLVETVTKEPLKVVPPPDVTEEVVKKVDPPVDKVDPPDTVKTPPGSGVDLAPDSTGVMIPWDNRIHSGGKTKLAKAPHGWKLGRVPTGQTKDQWAATVAEVEAQLRELMAIPGGQTPAATEQNAAQVFGSEETTGTTEAAEGIKTFAQLLVAITSHGKTSVEVTDACNKHDIVALPLLGAREDLVPAIAAELFPELAG